MPNPLTYDTQRLTDWVIAALLEAPLVELHSKIDPPKTPGVYVLGMHASDRERIYQPLVAAGAATYAGSTIDLFRRLRHYGQRLADVGLESAHPVAKWVAFDDPVGLGRARLAEVVLQAALPLCWNQPGPLHGIGTIGRGKNRNEPQGPWWQVHCPTPDPNLVAEARLWCRANAELAPALLLP